MTHTPFGLDSAEITGGAISGHHALVILLRMLCAFVLGAIVAYRPWRRLPGYRAPRPAIDIVQAQTIIAVAGALVVVVIGDSLARAFGLVGLGTFIRFRSGIKDPRDVALMFVMIGVGMACGLGLVPTAAVGTLFVSITLALFDRFAPAHARRMRVSVTGADPLAVRDALRGTCPSVRVVSLPKAGPDGTKVVLELETATHLDVLSVRDALQDAGVGVEAVRLEKD